MKRRLLIAAASVAICATNAALAQRPHVGATRTDDCQDTKPCSTDAECVLVNCTICVGASLANETPHCGVIAESEK